MADNEADSITPGSSIITLVQMDQQTWVRSHNDDWTGIVDRAKRKKLQNRLNQRAYRSRKIEGSKKTQSRPSTASSRSMPSDQSRDISNNTEEMDFKCADAPPHALDIQRHFEDVMYQNYLYGSPKISHLITVTCLNVHWAICDNIIAIGMTPEWMKNDDSISIFNHVAPRFYGGQYPS